MKCSNSNSLRNNELGSYQLRPRKALVTVSYKEELSDSGYVSETNSEDSYSSPKKKKSNRLLNPPEQSKQSKSNQRNRHSSPDERIKKNLIRSTTAKLHVSTPTTTVHSSRSEKRKTENVQPPKRGSSTTYSRLPLKFICDICGFRANMKDKLSHHINTHSGAKPFKCEECPMSFSHPRSLTYVPECSA